MFQCHVCGASEAEETFVDEVFHVANKHLLVQQIPATVCARCGEKIFSRETTERIRRMLHGDTKPIKSIPLEVFAYA